MNENSLNISISISIEDEGLRLDKFIANLEEISSRNYAKMLIDKGFVLVDKKTPKASLALKINQVVEINLPPPEETTLQPYNFKLDIIFEDKDLIIVNKPSGLVVHPAAGHQQDTLVNALLFHTKDLCMKNEMRPGIVHRIDKETSGLLVVAKNDRAHDELSKQFKNKTTHRVYYALIDGNLPRAQGVCKSYLSRHISHRKKFTSYRENNKIINEADLDIPGKWAVTHFTKLAQSTNMSYIKLKLETGRTHQIRVHMQELMHSLVGDTLYGYSIKKMRDLELTRFYLHAAELGFTHPTTNENLLFKAPWPEVDLNKLLAFGFTHEQISK